MRRHVVQLSTCLGHASSSCSDSDLCVDKSGVMLLQDLCVRALVLSRLDYCNAVFAGLPATTLTCRPAALRELVASLAEDRVQAVFAGSQDTARPFVKVPQRPVDPRC